MQRLRTLAVAAVLLAAFAAPAKEVKGVQVPDTVTAGGKTLQLNGAGVRKFIILGVYVGALYLEEPSHDPSAILGKDAVRSVELHMLMDLGKDRIFGAIREGFEKNSKDKLPALKDRLDELLAQMPEKVTKGQVLRLTYVPGKGTTVTGEGKETMIEGKDFADALFSVWLGAHPVDDGLKKGMLGLED
jgi:chalcone isomerase-like protein